MEAKQEDINYQRITQAIRYIQANFKERPSLQEIAEHVGLSPFHFQRIFTQWAGTSPKQFLRVIQLAYAKELLREQKSTLLQTQYQSGLSSASRLHELFVQIEAMTPAEYKMEGEGLKIHYSFQKSLFGDCLIASTEKGVCYMAFINDKQGAIKALKSQFPLAEFKARQQDIHIKAAQAISPTTKKPEQIKLHIKGSPFQIKVWQALLQIPRGQISSYKDIATAIGKPQAARAVGTAIAQNLVAYLIPCHRVIQSSGALGGYRWDPNRKAAILGWEFIGPDTTNTMGPQNNTTAKDA